jgi:hypothetical protein
VRDRHSSSTRPGTTSGDRHFGGRSCGDVAQADDHEHGCAKSENDLRDDYLLPPATP